MRFSRCRHFWVYRAVNRTILMALYTLDHRLKTNATKYFDFIERQKERKGGKKNIKTQTREENIWFFFILFPQCLRPFELLPIVGAVVVVDIITGEILRVDIEAKVEKKFNIYFCKIANITVNAQRWQKRSWKMSILCWIVPMMALQLLSLLNRFNNS